jgi:hypothetical protein
MFSFTLRGEQKSQVAENKTLRKIFWSKKDEVSWQFRMLHNEELCGLASKGLKSKKLQLATHVS